MIIANPIYDVVFKRLMENERVAKFFISTLLSQVVESLEVQPQEFTYTDRLAGLAVFRLDFIAVIKLDNGETKKILIEIQKAKNQIDLMRFRNYLAEQYKKEDQINGRRKILPITTIYILGFKIPEIVSACFHVERQYKDLINNEYITERSAFVERLTHDSFVVQVQRIEGRYQTKLDKLLSVFEQQHFLDSSEVIKEYKYQIDEEDVQIITDILHHTGTDPESRKQIEIEQEAWRTVNAMFDEKEREYQEALNQKDKVLDEKNRIIAELRRKLKDD